MLPPEIIYSIYSQLPLTYLYENNMHCFRMIKKNNSYTDIYGKHILSKDYEYIQKDHYEYTRDNNIYTVIMRSKKTKIMIETDIQVFFGDNLVMRIDDNHIYNYAIPKIHYSYSSRIENLSFYNGGWINIYKDYILNPLFSNSYNTPSGHWFCTP